MPTGASATTRSRPERDEADDDGRERVHLRADAEPHLREDGAWDNEGWTTDAATALVGDAHVGVGWRKGPLQTSVGYIHREVKGQHMLFGQKAKEDSVVAFSFTVKPEQD